MDVFNIFCGACSVAGMLVSVFTASKVLKISQTMNCNNKDDNSKVINKSKNSTYSGSYVGRDNVNGTGSSEQKRKE